MLLGGFIIAVLEFPLWMAENKSSAEKQLENLGKRLRALRKAAGFTSAEKFAYANEINRTQYGQYENGSDIRFSSLIKILDALKITPAEFFNEGFELEEGER